MTAAERDDAYAPLEASDVLPALSWICFSFALAARPLARLLPRQFRVYPWVAIAPTALSAAFALLGLTLALVALRRARRRGLAKLGVALNAIVLGLTALAALGISWILRR